MESLKSFKLEKERTGVRYSLPFSSKLKYFSHNFRTFLEGRFFLIQIDPSLHRYCWKMELIVFPSPEQKSPKSLLLLHFPDRKFLARQDIQSLGVLHTLPSKSIQRYLSWRSSSDFAVASITGLAVRSFPTNRMDLLPRWGKDQILLIELDFSQLWIIRFACVYIKL